MGVLIGEDFKELSTERSESVSSFVGAAVKRVAKLVLVGEDSRELSGERSESVSSSIGAAVKRVAKLMSTNSAGVIMDLHI